MTMLHALLSPSGLQITAEMLENISQAPQPDGVYTITRTFQTDSALLLDSHLNRLEESARLENIPLMLDRAALRAALRTLIQQSGNTESRFRITVPRDNPQTLHLALEPLKPISPEMRRNGVQVITLDAHRHNPAAKTTAWMQARQTALANAGQAIYEGILLDEAGYLLEGTSSNFYAVLAGELRTAEKGILKGIARQALLASIGDLLPLRLEPIHQDDLPQLSEAFLTSSSRGVLGIVQINGQTIADGTPQPFTLELSRRYEAWTTAHLEPI